MARFDVLHLLVTLLAGCASIHSSETVQQVSLPPEVLNRTVPESAKYVITGHTHGELVSVHVEQSETCATITTQRTHQRTLIAKTADPTVVRTEWTVALTGVVAGAYGYLNADGLAARDAASDQSGTSAEDYRNYAIALMAVGIGAALIGSIDHLRALDETRDDGIIRGERQREEHECHHRATEGENVEVVFPSGRTVSARLDERGHADVSMITVPEQDLPEQPVALTVELHNTQLELRISTADWAQLRAVLLANSSSQLAIDVLNRRKARCTTLVADAHAAARERIDTAFEEVHKSWDIARTGCEDLWTPELESERVTVEDQVAARRCSARFTQLGDSIDAETTVDGLSPLASELVELRTSCASPANAQVELQLETKLAAKNKRIITEQEQEARRIAREEARQRIEEQRRAAQQAARARAWDSASLVCNDGMLSPTCTCGGSHQGCCSHHGGVAGCSADR